MPAVLPSIRSRVSQMLDAPTLGGSTRLWVDGVRGSNTTGTRGRRDLPYLTAAAAKAAASAGDTVHVMTMLANENDLAKNGVNWHFAPNTGVAYTNANVTGALRGIFDDYAGAASYNITGYGTFSMDLTEGAGGGSQIVNAINIGNASSNVNVRAKSVTTIIQPVESGTMTGSAIRQANGAATIKADSVSEFRASGGTSSLRAFTAGLLIDGGTLDAHVQALTALGQSSGTSRVRTNNATSNISCSGGAMMLRAINLLGVTHGNGDLRLNAITCKLLTRNGSSGDGHYTVQVWGDGTNEAIIVSQSGTARCFFRGGRLESTASPLAMLTGGKIIIDGLDVHEMGVSDTHGNDIAIGVGFGGSTDSLFRNLRVKCDRASHSCIRVYAEDTSASRHRFDGGLYQPGASGFWFDPEGNPGWLASIYNTLTASKAAGPFGATVGSGAIVIDPNLSL
jgi:hypothetical protein